MQQNLMTSRRFAPLFWTQFLSAFNDNFLKNTLVFLILATVAAEEAGSLVTLAGAVFMAPFLLFSALGGELADKFDKAVMAERLKRVELVAAGVAVVGLAFHSITVLMLALFLFGVISALFGPVKYGILPDHLERKELPRANAWIEGATFIAILGGTLPGPALRITRAALAGRTADAVAESERLAPLWALFAELGGSLRVVAAIAEQLGLVLPRCLPLPIQGLDERQRTAVARVVDELRLAP